VATELTERLRVAMTCYPIITTGRRQAQCIPTSKGSELELRYPDERFGYSGRLRLNMIDGRPAFDVQIFGLHAIPMVELDTCPWEALWGYHKQRSCIVVPVRERFCTSTTAV
jgi:hypothetical protein